VEIWWDGRIWHDQWSQGNIELQESVTLGATVRVIEIRAKWRRKCSLLNFRHPHRCIKWSKGAALVRISFAKTLLCALSDILGTCYCGFVCCCSDTGDNWLNSSLHDTVYGSRGRKQEEGLMISWRDQPTRKATKKQRNINKQETE